MVANCVRNCQSLWASISMGEGGGGVQWSHKVHVDVVKSMLGNTELLQRGFDVFCTFEV